MKIQYDPDSIFEQNEQKGGSCDIKSFWQSVSASSTNHELIAAVSGKKHRILVLNALALTNPNLFSIKSSTSNYKFSDWASNNGGTFPKTSFFKAETVGLIESNSGESLTADTASSGAVVLCGRYITLIG